MKPLFFLLFFLPLACVNAAQISGHVYDFYTLEKIDNAVISINTAPNQQVVAKLGYYSFQVPPGSYVIEAKYFDKGDLTYYSADNLSIPNDGQFDFDLLLEPFGNSTGSIIVPEIPSDVDEGTFWLWLPYILVGIAIFAVYYLWSNRTQKSAESIPIEVIEEPTPPISEIDAKIAAESMAQGSRQKVQNAGEEDILIAAQSAVGASVSNNSSDLSNSNKISDDAKLVLDAIIKSEGRIQQRELRRIFKFSEAKMSNLLDELEECGKIRRIKKGRGNLIKSI